MKNNLNRLLKYNIFLCLLHLILSSELNSTIKPVIGVLCNPFPFDSNTTNVSSIYNSDLKWLNFSNFKILPIYYNYSESMLKKIIPKLNGILFQSGDRNVVNNNGVFEKTFFAVTDLAIKYKVPSIFICQGFQMLHNYYNKSLYYKDEYNRINHILETTNSKNYSTSGVKLDLKNLKKYNTFKYFSNYDICKIFFNKKRHSTLHNHNYSIKPDLYNNVKSIRNNLAITSYALDQDNKLFVNSVESKNFKEVPFMGFQFHPEIATLINDNSFINLKNPYNSQVGYKILLAFKHVVEKHLKKSKCKFSSEEEKLYAIIDNIYKLKDFEINNKHLFYYSNK